MIRDDIDQLLKNLRLRRIAEILERELARAVETHCSYDDFLTRILREQWIFQQERSLAYRIDQAALPERWSLDTFPFDKQPGVDATVVRQLASLDFITSGTNIVLIGPTGVGKTGIASGILLKVLQNGHRGLFIKAQDLFDEMYASLADRATRRLIDRLSRVDVLLVDELGYLNLRPEQANIFFKLMEERYTRHKPTLITTNLEYDDWHTLLGNKQMVAALIDRLRHRCHTVRIEGPTLRDPLH